MVETGTVTLGATPSASFTDQTGDLPVAVASNSVVFDAGDLVVATDVGVFSTPVASLSGASTSWSAVGSALPNVQVIGLTLDAAGNLYAATHGRGIWKLAGFTPPSAPTAITPPSLAGSADRRPDPERDPRHLVAGPHLLYLPVVALPQRQQLRPDRRCHRSGLHGERGRHRRHARGAGERRQRQRHKPSGHLGAKRIRAADGAGGHSPAGHPRHRPGGVHARRGGRPMDGASIRLRVSVVALHRVRVHSDPGRHGGDLHARRHRPGRADQGLTDCRQCRRDERAGDLGRGRPGGRRARPTPTPSPTPTPTPTPAPHGQPGPSPSTIRHALGDVLAAPPAHRPAARAASFTLQFAAPSAGHLTVTWSVRIPHAGPRPVAIAALQVTVTRAGHLRLRLVLSPRGRQLLQHSRRLWIQAASAFTPRGGRPTSAARGFWLTH